MEKSAVEGRCSTIVWRACVFVRLQCELNENIFSPDVICYVYAIWLWGWVKRIIFDSQKPPDKRSLSWVCARSGEYNFFILVLWYCMYRRILLYATHEIEHKAAAPFGFIDSIYSRDRICQMAAWPWAHLWDRSQFS